MTLSILESSLQTSLAYTQLGAFHLQSTCLNRVLNPAQPIPGRARSSVPFGASFLIERQKDKFPQLHQHVSYKVYH